jgi:hypothetical protein
MISLKPELYNAFHGIVLRWLKDVENKALDVG